MLTRWPQTHILQNNKPQGFALFRKIAVFAIILVLSLSGFLRPPAAYCFQDRSHAAGICKMQEHKSCARKSCDVNPFSTKTCGLRHSGHQMAHGARPACRLRIGCSHPDGSSLLSTLSDEDVCLPSKIEPAFYLSLFSSNIARETTYNIKIPFPIERPPAS